VTFTEYHHYTTRELLRLARSKENPTPLEQELLRRLENLLGENDDGNGNR
jgi:hypothetical protein